jgi:hypothetical protein
MGFMMVLHQPQERPRRKLEDALKSKEDLTFSQAEIDALLPKDLRPIKK